MKWCNKRFMEKIVFLLFIAQMHILFAGSFVEYPGSTFDKKLTEKAQVATDAAGFAVISFGTLRAK